MIGSCHVFVCDEDYKGHRKMVKGSVGSSGDGIKRLLDTLFGDLDKKLRTDRRTKKLNEANQA